MKSKNKFLVLLLAATILIVPALASAGYTYDANNLISARQYYNSNGMTRSDIQKFLETRGSGLATQKVGNKKISDLVYEACKSYGLNPKVLLVMYQKEQSLISTAKPDQDQLDCALGYGSCNSKYDGIEVQTDYAAYSLGEGYDKKKGQYTYEAGKTTKTQDGVDVTPANDAVANLFIYNPVYGKEKCNGNCLFNKLWDDYFGSWFPTGTLVQVKGQPGVYLIDKNEQKHGFWGSAAFGQTYQAKQIIQVEESDLTSFGSGDPIEMRDGLVLRDPDGAVYISQGGERLGIPDQDTLHKLGYDNSDPVDAGWTEVNLLSKGENFDKDNFTRPDGTFIKTADNPAVYLLDQGKKRGYWDKQILGFNYSGQINVVEVSKKEMDGYAKGPAVKFRDGALLTTKNSPGIFVIANGKKRGIGSMEIFKGLGYKTKNVMTVNDAVLNLHPNGETIKTY